MAEEWTADMVAAHFAAAVRTWRQFPVSARQRCGCDWFDSIDAVCGSASGDSRRASAPASVPPSIMADLERAIAWSAWIKPDERHLVWARAARVPWKRIVGQLGCDRTTAWRRWQLALTKIAGRLNAE